MPKSHDQGNSSKDENGDKTTTPKDLEVQFKDDKNKKRREEEEPAGVPRPVILVIFLIKCFFLKKDKLLKLTFAPRFPAKEAGAA